MVETKPGNKALYVFERNFPLGQNPEYIIYKLDTNLNVKAQKSIVLPNSFSIFSMNAFEIDENDNLYFAGDGQYPDGPGFSPASFVMKLDKNLVTKWKRMDSTQTSYSRLHVDRNNNVWVIADYYAEFPNIYVKKINSSGQLVKNRTYATDPGRYSLSSMLDKDNNLLLYGGKSVTDTTQAVYLTRISSSSGAIMYNRSLFVSPGTQLQELKQDPNGNLLSLVSQYLGPDNQVSLISRIKVNNGAIQWNKTFHFGQDSSLLYKLVVNDEDRFFVIGERRSSLYFSKGFAMRIKKANGATDRNFAGPDSVFCQRSHWLVDGITDKNNQLIAIGNTMDLDTTTFSNTYLRAFAIRYTNDNNCDEHATTPIVAEENPVEPAARFTVYPNPAQNRVMVSNINTEKFDLVTVYDLRGMQLMQQAVKGTTASFDVSALANGVYIISMRSTISGKQETIRFVVKR